jgi:hypothetical protein
VLNTRSADAVLAFARARREGRRPADVLAEFDAVTARCDVPPVRAVG